MTEAIVAPSASTARSMSSVATWSPCSSASAQTPRREAGPAPPAHDPEEVGAVALRVQLARADLHRAAPGVGLEAAATPARAGRAVEPHDHVPDLARGAAAVPLLAVEDQAAADAGAPEDAEQAPVRRAGAELELGRRRDADVVADDDRRAERVA